MCVLCEREVKANHASIECATCCSWIHKGCSGLDKLEYNKICADFKRNKSHNWECELCKKMEVRRLSVGDVGGSTSVSPVKKVTNNSMSHSSVTPPAEIPSERNLGTEISEVKIQDQISNLLKKTNISNKDVLSAISHLVKLLLTQKNEFQSALEDIRKCQHEKDKRIDWLETEIVELKDSIKELKTGKTQINIAEDTSRNIVTDQDMFVEIQERSVRSKNIMLFGVMESHSKIVSERIDHDKGKILEILNKLETPTDCDFKVVRVGKVTNKPRPMKIIFSDSSIAVKCLKFKYKLKSTDFQIKPDLTLMQRNHLNKLYKEVEHRKSNGEGNIGVRYKNGYPYIGSNSLHRPQVENVMPKN